MINQNLLSSVPSKWEEKFILKRIGEEDIEITLRERDAILAAMEGGARFIQVKKHTIMVNSMKGIDPKWGEANIPPRPKEQIETKYIGNEAKITVGNKEELDEWDKLFK